MPTLRWAIATAIARGVLAFALSLSFWAAAPLALGWHSTTIASNSMSPVLDTGDIVVFRPTPATDLRAGQIVLFDDPDHPGRLRAHRLDAHQGDTTWRTRGDANRRPDTTPIHTDRIHGVGYLKVPLIGLPLHRATRGDPTLLIAVAAVLGLALYVATRRPKADAGGPDDHGASDGRRARRDRVRRGRVGAMGRGRGIRTVGGAASIIALVVAAPVAAAPAWAAFTDARTLTATFGTASITPPTAVECVQHLFGPDIRWQHPGGDVASFDVLIDGEPVGTALPADARKFDVPWDRYFFITGTYTVTVRANLTGTWAATSTDSAYLGGGFLGAPVCR